MRQAGVVVGIVSSIAPADGTVQLEFPWLDESLRSANAPVAMPMSGGDRGMFFMPEVGDEALVAFEHGDFDHPFVIGFLWNGVDKAPEKTIKNRVICTPGGHTLRFEDSDNQKKVILRSSSGHSITMDDTSAGQSVTVQTNGGLSITLDDKAGGSITLSGGGRSLAMSNGTVQIT